MSVSEILRLPFLFLGDCVGYVFAFVGNWLASRPMFVLAKGLMGLLPLVVLSIGVIPTVESALTFGSREVSSDPTDKKETDLTIVDTDQPRKLPAPSRPRVSEPEEVQLSPRVDRNSVLKGLLSEFASAIEARDRGQVTELREQIDQVLQLGVDLGGSAEFHEQAFRYRESQRNVAGALEHLSLLVEERPEFLAEYAKFLKLDGKTAESASVARRAVMQCNSEIVAAADMEESIPSIIRCSLAFRILDNPLEAIRTLKVLPQSAIADNKQAREALINAYLARDAELRISGDLSERFKNLREALEIDSESIRVSANLAGLAAESEEADVFIAEMLEEGSAPWPVHQVLGIRAVSAGDTEAALPHMQKAAELNPRSVLVLNNLAWLYMLRKENLDEALKLTDKALLLDPNEGDVYHTRGNIYLKQEKFTEAIGALETSLRLLDGREDVHEALMRAYKAVGETEIAESHRKERDSRESAGPPSP